MLGLLWVYAVLLLRRVVLPCLPFELLHQWVFTGVWAGFCVHALSAYCVFNAYVFDAVVRASLDPQDQPLPSHHQHQALLCKGCNVGRPLRKLEDTAAMYVHTCVGYLFFVLLPKLLWTAYPHFVLLCIAVGLHALWRTHEHALTAWLAQGCCTTYTVQSSAPTPLDFFVFGVPQMGLEWACWYFGVPTSMSAFFYLVWALWLDARLATSTWCFKTTGTNLVVQLPMKMCWRLAQVIVVGVATMQKRARVDKHKPELARFLLTLHDNYTYRWESVLVRSVVLWPEFKSLKSLMSSDGCTGQFARPVLERSHRYVIVPLHTQLADKHVALQWLQSGARLRGVGQIIRTFGPQMIMQVLAKVGSLDDIRQCVRVVHDELDEALTATQPPNQSAKWILPPPLVVNHLHFPTPVINPVQRPPSSPPLLILEAINTCAPVVSVTPPGPQPFATPPRVSPTRPLDLCSLVQADYFAEL